MSWDMRRINILADELFKETDRKYKVGALLRGLRARENLSQIEFAKRYKSHNRTYLKWKMVLVRLEK